MVASLVPPGKTYGFQVGKGYVSSRVVPRDVRQELASTVWYAHGNIQPHFEERGWIPRSPSAWDRSSHGIPIHRCLTASCRLRHAPCSCHLHCPLRGGARIPVGSGTIDTNNPN